MGETTASATSTYDDLNRVTGASQNGPAGPASFTFAYDNANLVTGMTWSGLGVSDSISNSFAKAGQWQSSTMLGRAWNFSWGADGRLRGEASGPLASRQPLRYRGYYYDAETAFYYLPARYYDPATYRFLSPDPAPPSASNPLSLNAYSYCQNDPVNASDPTGEVMTDIYLNGELTDPYPGSGMTAADTREEVAHYVAAKRSKGAAKAAHQAAERQIHSKRMRQLGSYLMQLGASERASALRQIDRLQQWSSWAGLGLAAAGVVLRLPHAVLGHGRCAYFARL